MDQSALNSVVIRLCCVPGNDHFESFPNLVKNIFIWVTVVFWASSRMMTCIGERSPAHIGKRRHFDKAFSKQRTHPPEHLSMASCKGLR